MSNYIRQGWKFLWSHKAVQFGCGLTLTLATVSIASRFQIRYWTFAVIGVILVSHWVIAFFTARSKMEPLFFGIALAFAQLSFILCGTAIGFAVTPGSAAPPGVKAAKWLIMGSVVLAMSLHAIGKYEEFELQMAEAESCKDFLPDVIAAHTGCRTAQELEDRWSTMTDFEKEEFGKVLIAHTQALLDQSNALIAKSRTLTWVGTLCLLLGVALLVSSMFWRTSSPRSPSAPATPRPSAPLPPR